MLANTLIAWWRQHGSVAGTAAFATGMLKFAEEMVRKRWPRWRIN
jgi:hypothetical protein